MSDEHTRFGFDESTWHAGKQEIREILVGRARVQGFIPYSTLVAEMRSIHLEPNSYALAEMLGELSTEEDAAGRGLLTVIVVHKEGDMQPGPGFFDLAKRLGRDTTDVLACWVDEFKKVHGYWRDH